MDFVVIAFTHLIPQPLAFSALQAYDLRERIEPYSIWQHLYDTALVFPNSLATFHVVIRVIPLGWLAALYVARPKQVRPNGCRQEVSFPR